MASLCLLLRRVNTKRSITSLAALTFLNILQYASISKASPNHISHVYFPCPVHNMRDKMPICVIHLKFRLFKRSMRVVTSYPGQVTPIRNDCKAFMSIICKCSRDREVSTAIYRKPMVCQKHRLCWVHDELCSTARLSSQFNLLKRSFDFSDGCLGANILEGFRDSLS